MGITPPAGVEGPPGQVLTMPPEALAMVEGLMRAGRTGAAILHLHNGRILAWTFNPGGRKPPSSTA